MDLDPSESVVSPETANKRLSSDMSGHLRDMPGGTTASSHMTNTCLPAGEDQNKTSIFISGLHDTLDFLVWLRPFCPGGLKAQHKAEKLIVLPSTVNVLKAAVSALRSLDEGRV